MALKDPNAFKLQVDDSRVRKLPFRTGGVVRMTLDIKSSGLSNKALQKRANEIGFKDEEYEIHAESPTEIPHGTIRRVVSLFKDTVILGWTLEDDFNEENLTEFFIGSPHLFLETIRFAADWSNFTRGADDLGN